MIVSAIKRKHNMIAVLTHYISHTELMRSDGITFETYTEDFGFDTVHNAFYVFSRLENPIV